MNEQIKRLIEKGDYRTLLVILILIHYRWITLILILVALSVMEKDQIIGFINLFK